MIIIGVESDIVIRDRASAALENVINHMNRIIEISDRLDKQIIEVDASLDRLDSSGIEEIPPAIQQAELAQNEFNDEIDKSIDLMTVLKGVVAGLGIKKALDWAVEQSDQYATTRARIDLMNDGLRTTTEVQDMIFQSALNARAEYQSMADMVGRIGTLAGDAFSSTEEITGFAELIQKQFTIAGTSASEAAGATTQLVQALASGVLRGDELNSIFEQAPTIIQSIADYLDVPVGQIRELASEGKITADIVKNAMFAAADDINTKFESMPKTWSNHVTTFTNHLQKAFEPVSQMLSDLANSQQVQAILNGIINSLYVMANITTRVLSLLGSLANFVISNFNVIAPILSGIAAILAVYYARTVAVWVATKAVAVAQWAWNKAVAAFNAIMAMNPFAIAVIGIIAIISLLYAGVAMWNNFTGAAVSATGIIAGAIFWLGAGIFNVIKGIANILIVFAQLIINAFQFAIVTVAYIIATLVTIVLAVIDAIIQIVLMGVNLFVAIWNMGIFATATVIHGLVILVLMVFDAIINAVYWVVEIFVNAWNNGVYGVELAFYKMGQGIESVMNAVAQGAVGVVNSALGLLSDLVNAAIGGLNTMINAANAIPGVNISSIGEVDFRVSTAGIEGFSLGLEAPEMPERFSLERSDMAGDFLADNPFPEFQEAERFDGGTSLASDFMDWIADNLGDFDFAEFDTLDWTKMGDAFDKGYEFGESIDDWFGNLFKGNNASELGEGMSDLADILESVPEPDLGAGDDGGKGGNPTGGKLDSIGEIEDEIDVNDEVIKYMKDIANLRYQQNFITLTPEIINNNQFVDAQDQEDAVAKFNADIAEALYSGIDGVVDY